MAVRVAEYQRTSGINGIQHLLGRKLPRFKLVHTPACAANQRRLRVLLDAAPDTLQHRVDARQVKHGALGVLDAAGCRVGMGILEPRQNHAPVEVDHPRAGVNKSRGILTHVNNPAILDSQLRRPGLRRVNRIDARASQHEIGRLARCRVQKRTREDPCGGNTPPPGGGAAM